VERKSLVDALLSAIAAAAFAWLAVQRRTGATLKVDLAVRARVHEFAAPPMTTLARILATAGSPVALPFFFAIAVAAFHLLRWSRATVTLTAVMAVAIVCNVGLKRLIHSARPAPFFGAEPSSYSFPSGHALYSLSFYGVLAGALAAHAPPGAARLGIWAAAALLVLGIGLSRIYLGVHYPSDVVGGYLGALFALFAVGAVSALVPG
jgi:undecaprenyl-diphosphatase